MNRLRLTKRWSAILGLCLLGLMATAVGVYAQVGGGYSIIRSNFDSSGGGSSSAGGYTLNGTLGQHDAGTLINGSWTLRGGFWSVPLTSPTATPTGTQPTATRTYTPLPTNTAGPTDTPGGATSTAGPTDTPEGATSTPVVTGTPTICMISFTDVPPDSTFYPYVICLACRGIINGYTSGCESGNPCFRPNNLVTRGQLAKIVSNSAGFSDPPGGQLFQDVASGSTFFDFVYRLASRGYIGGYPCGGPGEPCVPPDNLPYFRTNNNATRGQISKIVSNAAGFVDPPAPQIFEDVPPGSTFFDYIQRLAWRGVMAGYACGGTGEPCVPPDNRPYFRPNSNATRGQTSKIVSRTFFPACSPNEPTPTTEPSIRDISITAHGFVPALSGGMYEVNSFRWTNNDTIPRTLQPSSGWPSTFSPLNPGDSVTLSPPYPGYYYYHSVEHPSQTALIIVDKGTPTAR